MSGVSNDGSPAEFIWFENFVDGLFSSEYSNSNFCSRSMQPAGSCWQTPRSSSKIYTKEIGCNQLQGRHTAMTYWPRVSGTGYQMLVSKKDSTPKSAGSGTSRTTDQLDPMKTVRLSDRKLTAEFARAVSQRLNALTDNSRNTAEEMWQSIKEIIGNVGMEILAAWSQAKRCSLRLLRMRWMLEVDDFKDRDDRPSACPYAETELGPLKRWMGFSVTISLRYWHFQSYEGNGLFSCLVHRIMFWLTDIRLESGWIRGFEL